MSRGPRRRAYRFGHVAETLCVWSLRLRGYTVLARRYDARVGELDIVARRGGVLAIIEVKARRAGDDGDMLTAHQCSRIERAAEAYVARHRQLAGLDMRFDLMVVRPGRPPRHLADYWRPL